MLADDLSLGDDDDAFRVHPQADRAVGERRRHAVAIAVQMDQARRRHPFGVFDKAVDCIVVGDREDGDAGGLSGRGLVA
jgi:hypothetical protein